MLHLFFKKNWLLLIIVFGFILRLIFVFQMPAGNDEAFYMYDAFNINHGLIPYKDFFTKSVPYISLLALWQKIFGTDLILARLLTVTISLGGAYVMYLISYKLFHNRYVALLGTGVYLLDSYAASRSAFTATNYPFILMYLLTFYVFIKAVEKNSFLYGILSALFFYITYFTRQSAIFLVPFLFTYVFVNQRWWVLDNIRKSYSLIIKLSISLGIFVVLLLSTYYVAGEYIMGFARAREFTGVNLVQTQYNQNASISTNPFNIVKIFNVINAIIGMSVSSPALFTFLVISLILIAIIVLKKLKIDSTFILFVFISLLSIYVLFYIKSYIGHQIRGSVSVTLMLSLFILLLSMYYFFYYFLYRCLFHYKKNPIGKEVPRHLLTLFIGSASLLGAYLFNIKFDYILELYPLFAILAGYGIYWYLHTPQPSKKAKISILMFFFLMSFSINFFNINTGTHKLADMYEAVGIIKEKTSPRDTVFTGFPLFAMLADRHVPLNIAHPAWYGYDFVDNIRDDFMPTPETYYRELQKNKPKMAVIDKFTTSSYLTRYKQIRMFLKNNYRVVKKFRTFTLYERKDQ